MTPATLLEFAKPVTTAEYFYDYAGQDPINSYDLDGRMWAEPNLAGGIPEEPPTGGSGAGRSVPAEPEARLRFVTNSKGETVDLNLTLDAVNTGDYAGLRRRVYRNKTSPYLPKGVNYYSLDIKGSGKNVPGRLLLRAGS